MHSILKTSLAALLAAGVVASSAAADGHGLSGELNITSDMSNPAPRAVMEKMASDFRTVDQAFLGELREHFSDAEIAEIGLLIGQYMALGRMLVISGGHKYACEIYVPPGD